MLNIKKNILFKLTAIILINAFLCLDISWAANGNLKNLSTHLAPPLQINNSILKEHVAETINITQLKLPNDTRDISPHRSWTERLVDWLKKIYFSYFYDRTLASYLVDFPKDWLEANIDNDDEVLEIGCGSGHFTFYISQFCKHITGLDTNEILLNIAQNRKQDSKNVDLVKASALDMRFKDGSFSKVVSIRFFTMFSNREERDQLLKEYIRAVSSEGEILIAEPINAGRGRFSFSNKAEFEQFLTDNGLEAVIEEKNGYYLVQCKKSLAVQNLENALSRIEKDRTFTDQQKQEIQNILFTLFWSALPHFKAGANGNPVNHHTQVLENAVQIGLGEDFTYEEFKNAAILALLHDIGYAKLEGSRARIIQIRKKIEQRNSLKAKELAQNTIAFRLAHMKKAPEMIRELIQQLISTGILSATDVNVNLICGVVKAHDNPSIEQALVELRNMGVDTSLYEKGQFLFNFEGPFANASSFYRLITVWREADRLFMCTYQGIIADLEAAGIEITPEQIRARFKTNKERLEEEYRLYEKSGKDDGNFLGETLFRTETGHQMFLRAEEELEKEIAKNLPTIEGYLRSPYRSRYTGKLRQAVEAALGEEIGDIDSLGTDIQVLQFAPILLPIVKYLIQHDINLVIFPSKGADPIAKALEILLTQLKANNLFNKEIPEFQSWIITQKLNLTTIIWSLLTEAERVRLGFERDVYSLDSPEDLRLFLNDTKVVEYLREHRNVLIIDDIVETGVTLHKARCLLDSLAEVEAHFAALLKNSDSSTVTNAKLNEQFGIQLHTFGLGTRGRISFGREYLHGIVVSEWLPFEWTPNSLADGTGLSTSATGTLLKNLIKNRLPENLISKVDNESVLEQIIFYKLEQCLNQYGLRSKYLPPWKVQEQEEFLRSHLSDEMYNDILISVEEIFDNLYAELTNESSLLGELFSDYVKAKKLYQEVNVGVDLLLNEPLLMQLLAAYLDPQLKDNRETVEELQGKGLALSTFIVLAHRKFIAKREQENSFVPKQTLGTLSPVDTTQNTPLNVHDIINGHVPLEEIQVIGIDMDGTLVPYWGIIGEDNLDAFLNLLEVGYKLRIITGGNIFNVKGQVLFAIPKDKQGLLKNLVLYTISSEPGYHKFIYDEKMGDFVEEHTENLEDKAAAVIDAAADIYIGDEFWSGGNDRLVLKVENITIVRVTNPNQTGELMRYLASQSFMEDGERKDTPDGCRQQGEKPMQKLMSLLPLLEGVGLNTVLAVEQAI
ncbi:MAG: methyltransferase domain-containing protein [Candidatus Omnitrophota bacterium]